MARIRMAPCDYNGGAPDGYQCDKCGAKGVKLWRDYNTFLEHQELACAACLRAYAASQGRHGEVDSEGMWSKPGEDSRYKSDSFCWRVPAVPPPVRLHVLGIRVGPARRRGLVEAPAHAHRHHPSGGLLTRWPFGGLSLPSLGGRDRPTTGHLSGGSLWTTPPSTVPTTRPAPC